jgi:hypothetical protein
VASQRLIGRMGEGLGLGALHPAQLAASPIRFLPSGRRKFR